MDEVKEHHDRNLKAGLVASLAVHTICPFHGLPLLAAIGGAGAAHFLEETVSNYAIEPAYELITGHMPSHETTHTILDGISYVGFATSLSLGVLIGYRALKRRANKNYCNH